MGALAHGELTRYDMKSAEFLPFLSGISADSVSFSKDGQWVAYVGFPEGTLWRSKSDGSQRIQLTYPPLTAVLPSWSPDGKQIVFYGFLPGQKAKMYTVSTDGGTPSEQMPEDCRAETGILPGRLMEQRSSSAAGQLNSRSSIRILDMGHSSTFHTARLQGPIRAPLVARRTLYRAMTFDSRSLMLFDFQTQKWEEIAKITLGFPNWSKSGEYVYFLHEENQPSVMRVRIRDRKMERVADLKNFRQAGYWSVWLGLAPDDSPLLLRDTGTQEIYALDWQAQ